MQSTKHVTHFNWKPKSEFDERVASVDIENLINSIRLWKRSKKKRKEKNQALKTFLNIKLRLKGPAFRKQFPLETRFAKLVFGSFYADSKYLLILKAISSRLRTSRRKYSELADEYINSYKHNETEMS